MTIPCISVGQSIPQMAWLSKLFIPQGFNFGPLPIYDVFCSIGVVSAVLVLRYLANRYHVSCSSSSKLPKLRTVYSIFVASSATVSCCFNPGCSWSLGFSDAAPGQMFSTKIPGLRRLSGVSYFFGNSDKS